MPGSSLSISFSGIFAPILGGWYHYCHFTDKATDLSLYPITREQIQDSNSSPSNSKACHACNQFTDVSQMLVILVATSLFVPKSWTNNTPFVQYFSVSYLIIPPTPPPN